jgi:hypothetical protein
MFPDLEVVDCSIGPGPQLDGAIFVSSRGVKNWQMHRSLGKECVFSHPGMVMVNPVNYLIILRSFALRRKYDAALRRVVVPKAVFSTRPLPTIAFIGLGS